MRKDMDKIVFESRIEIDEICEALGTFLQEHPKAKNKDSAQKLSDLLDAMYMEW